MIDAKVTEDPWSEVHMDLFFGEIKNLLMMLNRIVEMDPNDCSFLMQILHQF
jgi:hypothetical protein